ncbi:hypothetical protein KM043_007072 [Ampulex compressa]|nr:hypothetical protein KM043_007072 [Ampulex compressa]
MKIGGGNKTCFEIWHRHAELSIAVMIRERRKRATKRGLERSKRLCGQHQQSMPLRTLSIKTVGTLKTTRRAVKGIGTGTVGGPFLLNEQDFEAESASPKIRLGPANAVPCPAFLGRVTKLRYRREQPSRRTYRAAERMERGQQQGHPSKHGRRAASGAGGSALLESVAIDSLAPLGWGPSEAARTMADPRGGWREKVKINENSSSAGAIEKLPGVAGPFVAPFLYGGHGGCNARFATPFATLLCFPLVNVDPHHGTTPGVCRDHAVIADMDNALVRKRNFSPIELVVGTFVSKRRTDEGVLFWALRTTGTSSPGNPTYLLRGTGKHVGMKEVWLPFRKTRRSEAE